MRVGDLGHEKETHRSRHLVDFHLLLLLFFLLIFVVQIFLVFSIVSIPVTTFIDLLSLFDLEVDSLGRRRVDVCVFFLDRGKLRRRIILLRALYSKKNNQLSSRLYSLLREGSNEPAPPQPRSSSVTRPPLDPRR